MPHSPYRTTVYPPSQDVDEYKRELNHHRASLEDGERDKWRDEALLDIGDGLAEHCDFLEKKLDIKKSQYGQLAKQNDTLKKENEALKEESQTQKMEIASLKSELEKAGAATGTEGQLGFNGDGTGVEANSQDVKSEIREAEKLEEGEGSLEAAEITNPRKRGAEIDAAMDGNAVKKGRTGKEVDMIP